MQGINNKPRDKPNNVTSVELGLGHGQFEFMWKR